MMKRQENKQRFYLWDYLWWMGEKLEQARRTGRVDGEMMLSIYIFALLIFPIAYSGGYPFSISGDIRSVPS